MVLSLVARDNRDYARAYSVWAGVDSRIDSEEFMNVVPMLGEDLSEEEITAMFEEVDKDGNGLIEFNEFCTMMGALQMNRDGHERNRLVGIARARAYARQLINESPDSAL